MDQLVRVLPGRRGISIAVALIAAAGCSNLPPTTRECQNKQVTDDRIDCMNTVIFGTDFQQKIAIGAVAGGVLGAAIGGAAGGPRGAITGGLAGAGVGAVTGAVISYNAEVANLADQNRQLQEQNRNYRQRELEADQRIARLKVDLAESQTNSESYRNTVAQLQLELQRAKRASSTLQESMIRLENELRRQSQIVRRGDLNHQRRIEELIFERDLFRQRYEASEARAIDLENILNYRLDNRALQRKPTS